MKNMSNNNSDMSESVYQGAAAHEDRSLATAWRLKGYSLMQALYNYSPGPDLPNDLHFRTGDMLLCLSESAKLWLYARNLRTGKIGLVPSNYVSSEGTSPRILPAWYDVGRREADRLLLRVGQAEGAYILRESSTAPGFYALSVRHLDPKNGFWKVQHYTIHVSDDGKIFHIFPKQKFRGIEKLLRHYQCKDAGLCSALSQPCAKDYKPPTRFEDVEVNRENIKKVCDLGTGNFGDVWRGKWDNVDVAVKVIFRTSCQGDLDREKILAEAKIMHKLNHPHVVQILGVCTQATPVYIITEYMCHGSLLSVLRKTPRGQLPHRLLINMMAQIADGMSYLESVKFVHRDLRADNILVGENNCIKVADFGLAHMLDENAGENSVYQPLERSSIPYRWTAPEALKRKNPVYSSKSDVWSFGMVMYEMITYGGKLYMALGVFGKSSKAQMNQKEVFEAVCVKRYRMPRPDNCPEELYSLMLQCWAQTPHERPSFKKLNVVLELWEFKDASNDRKEGD